LLKSTREFEETAPLEFEEVAARALDRLSVQRSMKLSHSSLYLAMR
jgi:hypothetical protein